MAKYKERIKARKMRKKGISIIVISRKLGVSKSSISEWCYDIILTKEQYKRLEKNKGISWKTGQRLGAERNREKRLNSIALADKYGKTFVKKISKRELALIASALYWSEGSKSNGTSSFMFVNSDPEMILVVKEFLVSVMNVAFGDIVCCIQINQIHEARINLVLNFWKNLLKLKDDQIRKPYYIKTKSIKVYENYDNYFGTCRLFVRKSKYVKYQMLGLIKALKEEILSA